MNRQDTLAANILESKGLFTRFARDFTDQNCTKQAPNLPNHVAWTCGHCALTMHRLAERFDKKPLPDTDFLTGDGKQGSADRFDTESICFGSEPVDDTAIYPTLDRSIAVYESACDRLADSICKLSDASLDTTLPWHDGEIAMWALIMRIAFHNGAHAGQLTDLRRALSMPPVIVPR